MRLIVSDIPDEGFEQELELPIILNDREKPVIAYVLLKIFRFDKKVFIEGTVKVSVLLKCSRCLNDFTHPLDVSFRGEYNPAEETAKEDEKELIGKELDLSFYSNDEINVDELIKEQLLLSIPMKPLCNVECAGICLKCGQDLIKGPCECKTIEVDPRLAPLQKLKESMKDRETS